METEKGNFEEKLRKLSTAQLIDLAFPEERERRMGHWIAAAVLILIALWWLLVLADSWGWINWPLWRYFLDHFVFQTDQPYKGNW